MGSHQNISLSELKCVFYWCGLIYKIYLGNNTGDVQVRVHNAMGQRTLLPPGVPPRYRNASQILPGHSEHTDTSLSYPHHKVIRAPRDTLKQQVSMKSIPEKNPLWNRKSEIAAALCLSWVISSLYSLIIDTALIRMTDPNVALCLCVFVGFSFF